MTATRSLDRDGHAPQPVTEPLEPTELRRRRRALGLTQAELAERLAVSGNTVARWERGELRVGHPRQVDRAIARLERSHDSSVAQASARERVGRRTRHAQERTATALLGRPRHQLPVELNSFVGRALELRRLADRLASARLLTLVGPGGVGKTRLALQLGTRVRDNYPDAVWLVELAPLADARMVTNAVAAALGIRERGRTPLARTLAESLRDQRLLLILDNCEHVLDGCAELVHDLLRACPRLTIMATSRESLRVSGEVRWPVPPLSVVAPADSPQASEAVQLFVERARAVHPEFALTAGNRDVLGKVCARLDGLPLAIELAAARVGAIPPRALLDQLCAIGSGLPLLSGGPRDVPARQQALGATIAWSYDQLDPEDRTLFRRLAPFHGCTVEAASAVCVGANAGPRSTSLDLPPLRVDAQAGLASLVDKSLLRMEEDEQGEAWYVMLETVREFALERLEASPEAAVVWRRHAWYYLGLAEQTKAGVPGMGQSDFVDRLEREHPNFRAALDWCQAHGYAEASLRLAIGLVWFWGVRGHLAEGRRRLESLLARFPLRDASGARALTHANALDSLGRIAAMQGDLKAAFEFEQQSLRIFESLGHTYGQSEALEGLALIAQQQGDLEQASDYLERSLAVLRSLGSGATDPLAIELTCRMLSRLGLLAHEQGDDDTARMQLEEAVRLMDAIGRSADGWPGRLYLAEFLRDTGDYERARAVGQSAVQLLEGGRDRRGLGLVLAALGSIATAQRQFADAHDYLSRSLRLNQDLGEPSGLALVLDRFAVLALAQGQAERALRLTGAAAAIRYQAGTLPSQVVQKQIDVQTEPARRALGRLAAPVLASGQRLSLAEAIAEAQAMTPSAAASAAPSPVGSLSARERQVAVLVGHGCTNRQIALELIVSEGTVATHVKHILAKLELRSRAQVAAWTAQNRLLDQSNSHPGGDHAAVPR